MWKKKIVRCPLWFFGQLLHIKTRKVFHKNSKIKSMDESESRLRVFIIEKRKRFEKWKRKCILMAYFLDSEHTEYFWKYILPFTNIILFQTVTVLLWNWVCLNGHLSQMKCSIYVSMEFYCHTYLNYAHAHLILPIWNSVVFCTILKPWLKSYKYAWVVSVFRDTY